MLLSGALSLAMLPASSNAAADLVLTAESVTEECVPGTEIHVPVNAPVNTGYGAGTIDLDWDKNALKLESVSYSENAPENLSSEITQGSYKISFGKYDSETDFTETGLFFTLNFTVTENAVPGDHQISLDQPCVYSADLKAVSTVTSAGTVTLTGQPEESVLIVEAGNTAISQGETGELRVPVSAVQNPGFSAGTVDIGWDVSALTLTGVEFGEIVKDTGCDEIKQTGSYTVGFGDMLAKSDIAETGLLFTLVFTVNEGASGELPITLSNAVVGNAAVKRVPVSLKNGAVIIEQATTTTTAATTTAPETTTTKAVTSTTSPATTTAKITTTKKATSTTTSPETTTAKVTTTKKATSTTTSPATTTAKITTTKKATSTTTSPATTTAKVTTTKKVTSTTTSPATTTAKITTTKKATSTTTSPATTTAKGTTTTKATSTTTSPATTTVKTTTTKKATSTTTSPETTTAKDTTTKKATSTTTSPETTTAKATTTTGAASTTTAPAATTVNTTAGPAQFTTTTAATTTVTETTKAQTTTASTTTAPAVTTEPADYMLGDVNFDGTVDSSDASDVLMEYAITSTGGAPAFTALQKLVANVNFDLTIDSADASDILVYYAYTSTGGSMSSNDFFKQ
ncbi:MAG TPA: hypothetical protein DCZ62_04485 [Ruminococcus sp.]|nr:hypothetical protein [Ruminococcus sp.]